MRTHRTSSRVTSLGANRAVSTATDDTTGMVARAVAVVAGATAAAAAAKEEAEAGTCGGSWPVTEPLAAEARVKDRVMGAAIKWCIARSSNGENSMAVMSEKEGSDSD